MFFIGMIKTIIYGIVEGITEWLPISSTGHMILLDQIVKLNVTSDFMDMFRVVIQFGAILAVIVIYFNKLNPFSKTKTQEQKHDTLTLWLKVLVASVPAAIIGLIFNDKIDSMFYNYITVAITLIVYGVLFIVVENYNKNKTPKISTLKEITYSTALFIGFFQVLSLIPGTSRSGATILGAILVGVSRSIATEFTFFLAIPVMFGASLLKMVKFGFAYTGTEIAIMLVGLLTAFIVSIIAIKFLMKYIKTNDFKAFGYYRIVLGIIVISYFLLTLS